MESWVLAQWCARVWERVDNGGIDVIANTAKAMCTEGGAGRGALRPGRRHRPGRRDPKGASAIPVLGVWSDDYRISWTHTASSPAAVSTRGTASWPCRALPRKGLVLRAGVLGLRPRGHRSTASTLSRGRSPSSCGWACCCQLPTTSTISPCSSSPCSAGRPLPRWTRSCSS